jgi:hypothetical protein
VNTQWLSYEELGQALGIAPASAKKLATRRKWARRPGNDGRTRVAVPIERLECRRDSPQDRAGDVPRAVPEDEDGRDKGEALVPVLHRHIERLEAELVAQRAEREAMRERSEGLTSRQIEAEEASAAPVLRESVEAFKAALHSERLLRDELRHELDLARRPWWRRLAG